MFRLKWKVFSTSGLLITILPLLISPGYMSTENSIATGSKLAETPSGNPPILVEYEEIYGSDNPQILIDQQETTRMSLGPKNEVVLQKYKKSNGSLIKEIRGYMNRKEYETLRELAKGLLEIPQDNPWTKDYLWEGTKSFTEAKITVWVGNKPHYLRAIMNYRDNNSSIRKVEDLPKDIVALKTLVDGKEKELKSD